MDHTSSQVHVLKLNQLYRPEDGFGQCQVIGYYPSEDMVELVNRDNGKRLVITQARLIEGFTPIALQSPRLLHWASAMSNLLHLLDTSSEHDDWFYRSTLSSLILALGAVRRLHFDVRDDQLGYPLLLKRLNGQADKALDTLINPNCAELVATLAAALRLLIKENRSKTVTLTVLADLYNQLIHLPEDPSQLVFS